MHNSVFDTSNFQTLMERARDRPHVRQCRVRHFDDGPVLQLVAEEMPPEFALNDSLMAQIRLDNLRVEGAFYAHYVPRR